VDCDAPKRSPWKSPSSSQFSTRGGIGASPPPRAMVDGLMGRQVGVCKRACVSAQVVVVVMMLGGWKDVGGWVCMMQPRFWCLCLHGPPRRDIDALYISCPTNSHGDGVDATPCNCFLCIKDRCPLGCGGAKPLSIADARSHVLGSSQLITITITTSIPALANPICCVSFGTGVHACLVLTDLFSLVLEFFPFVS
jgi:hypothetical protein